MNIKDEIIQILDSLFDFDPDEAVFTSFDLRDDLRLNDEELDSARESINETFGLQLTSEDIDAMDTIHDMIDLVSKRLGE